MNRRLAFRSTLLVLGAIAAAGAAAAAATERSPGTADAAAGAADSATAAADRRAIEQAVLDYAEAFYLMEPARIERSVHRELVKFGFFRDRPGAAYDGGAMNFRELHELAAGWNRNGKFDPATARREVAVLDVLDQTAAAKLVAEWGIDYMHLAKYEGRWQIIHVLWQTHP
jgi:hypothetical protein